MSKRVYYTLAQRVDGKWYPQFGDYDRAVVSAERADYHDGSNAVPLKDLKIVASGDSQAEVDEVMAVLNAGG